MKIVENGRNVRGGGGHGPIGQQPAAKRQHIGRLQRRGVQWPGIFQAVVRTVSLQPIGEGTEASAVRAFGALAVKLNLALKKRQLGKWVLIGDFPVGAGEGFVVFLRHAVYYTTYSY